MLIWENVNLTNLLAIPGLAPCNAAADNFPPPSVSGFPGYQSPPHICQPHEPGGSACPTAAFPWTPRVLAGCGRGRDGPHRRGAAGQQSSGGACLLFPSCVSVSRVKAMDSVMETGGHRFWLVPGRAGFPGGASGKESAGQCRRPRRRGFHPWVGRIPWRRRRQPAPVSLPGESHGQRSLVAKGHTGLKGIHTHTLRSRSSSPSCSGPSLTWPSTAHCLQGSLRQHTRSCPSSRGFGHPSSSQDTLLTSPG